MAGVFCFYIGLLVTDEAPDGLLEGYMVYKRTLNTLIFEVIKMTDTYRIVGTLQIEGSAGAPLSFKLQPDIKYLSPCRRYAVFYNSEVASGTDEAKKLTVLIKCLDGRSVSLTIDSSLNLDQVLTQIALKRQSIELVVDANLNVIGFNFPV